MRLIYILAIIGLLVGACNAGKTGGEDESAQTPMESAVERPAFDADSAYAYVEQLMAFGPRVPNTEAHRRAGDWLAGKLRSFGLPVIEQTADLKAFDGTILKARNIFTQINPKKDNRMLLLAHWDCRPWADADPDESNRSKAVDGANDGASGVGVILEIARQLAAGDDAPGVDILFVDAEDWGSEGDDDSWALGTRYFAENPPLEGYRPVQAILLDMVGSPDARFGLEYFSRQSNPGLQQTIWSAAARLGHDKYFHTGFGGAVNDDHVQLIEHGIPAIDIIDYRGESGFDPVWHTSHDNMDNISRETLGAVGETVMEGIR